MFNKFFTNPIKNEIFREVILEGFHFLFEDRRTQPEILTYLNSLKPRDQTKLIMDINSIFIFEIVDKDQRVYKFLFNDYGKSKDLALNVMYYVADTKPVFLNVLATYAFKMYTNFIFNKFLNPNGFFNTKITGNKKLDAIIIQTVRDSVHEDLNKSKLPTGFDKYVVAIKNKIDDVVYDAGDKILDRIDEGWFSSDNSGKFIESIRLLLDPINAGTVNTIKQELKNMSKDDRKKYSEGGRSNSATIVTSAILQRTAYVLDKIKIPNVHIDTMLKIISLKLLANEPNIYNPIYKNVYKFLIEQLKKLKEPKNKISKYVAGKADYAGK